jgi:hypothetical protein
VTGGRSLSRFQELKDAENTPPTTRRGIRR